jgi:2-isopropylmalate synthase
MLSDIGVMSKEWSDAHKKEELEPEIVWKLFRERYMEPAGEIHLHNYHLTRDGTKVKAFLEVSVRGEATKTISGSGNGPIDAATNALKQLGYSFDVQSFHEHSRGEGSSAEAVAYVQVSSGDRSVFGVGIDPSTEHAAIEALVAGVNRLT